MKILLAQNASYFGLGGACKANKALVEALARRGHSCTVVCGEGQNDFAAHGFKYGDAMRAAELERDGVKIFAAKSAWEQAALVSKCLRAFKPDWTLVSETGVLLLMTALEHDPSRVVQIAHSTITNLPTEVAAETKKSVVSVFHC